MADITLTLYSTSSAPNVVHKKLSSLITLTGDLKQATDLENLVIVIPYMANFANINYAHVPQFNRYYFVKVEILNGELIRLTCKSDVLKSFWGSIQNSKCIARRSSSNYNPLLPDDRLAFSPQPTFIRRKTSTKFTPSSSSGSYILTIGGK